ncbi:FxsB family radical SAM/SPASM domain protein [Streptomyces sp. GC420]|nr:FxsB family radical SAM/SPASM domain protein [Streptomyces sp. GC420]
MSQFVLKLHSRCDLACDHCYVYEHADTSWKGRPRAASGKVLRRAAERIAEHAAAHGLHRVHVVFHGGEPLLAGPARIRRAAEELRLALDGVCRLELGIQTNGLQLSERYCDLFDEFGIRVGVSLDGDKEANDRHRRYADGRSSYDRVVEAVGLLRQPRYRHLYGGLLCTIDVKNDPVTVYDALAALDPPRIDFLLPHATHAEPPERPDGAPAPYADWLLTVHRRWVARGRPVPVRVFDSVERTLHGESSLVESLGVDPVDLAVIETDGSFEQADSLKVAFDGAPATGMDVFANSVDQVAAHPGLVARTRGKAGLCEQCRSCELVNSCGGGLYAHRYSRENGFSNPSVFCPDLMKLITAIRGHGTPGTQAETAAATRHTYLTEDQLDQLAAGRGDADTVSALAGAQLDITRGLVVAVWEQAPRDAASAAVWRLLAEADAAAPDAVDAVMAHPYTRTWARRRLEAAARRGAGGADTAGLAEFAAAAVLRAGDRYPASVRVPAPRGHLRLPGLGRVVLGAGTLAEVASAADGFTVTAPHRSLRVHWDEETAEGWQPVRRIALPGWEVAMEDVDPWRDAHGSPVSPRQDAALFATWAEELAGAWSLIAEGLPHHAPGLAAGLATITPLLPRHGGDVGGAARHAFGAAGIVRPAGPRGLALQLIRSFQEVKLRALLDLHDLYDAEDTRLLPSPWHSGPRPLPDLFLEAYARLGEGEFRAATRPGGQEADARRPGTGREVADVAERLLSSGSLTPLGERFARGMAGTAVR